MVEVIVKKTESLNGQVCASPSKSYTQRMVIASALANGSSKISNPLLSEDTEATLRAVTAVGAEVKTQNGCWTVEGKVPFEGAKEPIDCGESGARPGQRNCQHRNEQSHGRFEFAGVRIICSGALRASRASGGHRPPLRSCPYPIPSRH